MVNFVKIKCPECKNEQVVFTSPSSTVKCVICGHVLLMPTGGKGTVRGNVVEMFE